MKHTHHGHSRALLKALWTLALLLAFNAFGRAETYSFDVHRFGFMTFVTTAGKEGVEYETGDKQGSEVVFKSTLKPAGKNAFVTPGGTTFMLVKLAKPVINDGNREINSGAWRLTITGPGKDYAKIKELIPPPSFGSERQVYHGNLAKQ